MIERPDHIIPRSAWEQEGYPITGPAFEWPLESLVFHWPGFTSQKQFITPREEADHLRAVQRDYVNNRQPSYSIGYNWGFFQSGRVYELRGDTYRCAANGTYATNVKRMAFYVVLSPGERPSRAMTDSIIEMVHWLDGVGKKELPHFRHMDLKATTCPGEVLAPMVLKGDFHWKAPEPPDPILVPSSTEVEMIINYNKEAENWTALFWNGVDLKWYSSGNVYALQAGARQVDVNYAILTQLINDSRCVGPCPHTLVELEGLWLKRGGTSIGT